MNLKKYLATLMLLYFCGSSIYAQVKDKLVTISFKNIPLSEAMARIEKESGYTFFYDATQVNSNQKVSLNVSNSSIAEAVKTMLKHTGIQFEITNTQIALIGKKTKKTTGKPIVVRGTVLDENNEPVIGANVVVEGTTTGVITGDVLAEIVLLPRIIILVFPFASVSIPTAKPATPERNIS